MDRRIWTTLQLFAALFTKVPMIEARCMLPSAVLLIVYPAVMALWPEQPLMAFATAFMLCQIARFLLYSHRKVRLAEGKWLVWVCLLFGALFLAAQYPIVCQHVPSLVSLGFVILFAVDALDGSYKTVRGYWPGKTFAPYARELTQSMLVLHLTYILLNETVIKTASVEGWMVYYAFWPVVHHVLLTALFRSVFWLTPQPGQR
ncbi:hypothetical protein ACEN2J_12305 [Pseudorhodobacter sp. W20_MBD10_FR17]|uniref:hypothetical protein n=1 Tax=Pseudorhodobacter sp. W20_MBD10_FR17 TaxID=3240266 RepID=UPI003F96A191